MHGLYHHGCVFSLAWVHAVVVFSIIFQHKIYDDYSRCEKTVEDYLRLSSPHFSKNSLKSSNGEPKLSPITSTKLKSSRSSRSSKLKELKSNVELKKLWQNRH